MNFTGLSAFPLTPLWQGEILEKPFIDIMQNLANSKVDSIGILGSTGSYAYLNQQERFRVIDLAIEHSAGVPIMAGIGAVSTKEVLIQAEFAQKAGAAALMLAPMSYQKLTNEEVFGLFEDVCKNISVPLCVYDNPSTTHFSFTDEMYVKLSELPNVNSIKIPPIVKDDVAARSRVNNLRQILPEHISIGISGDWVGLTGLKAGCDVWYSGIAGVLPTEILNIVRAAQDQQFKVAEQLSGNFEVVWELCQQYGSIRVIAACAQINGLVEGFCLPAPLKPIPAEAVERLQTALKVLHS